MCIRVCGDFNGISSSDDFPNNRDQRRVLFEEHTEVRREYFKQHSIPHKYSLVRA